MTNLIDGILSYSSAVREEERVVEINLRMFIDEIVSGLSLPDNIKIIFETDTEVIYYGMTGLEQVFQNLLTNAIKYNDKAEGIIEIRCMKDSGDYKFSVSDNGIGIEEKYFDRIFQIFQTLAPHDKGETAGIGLAIVKKIIDNYGGKIWLESELGSGTTFYFTLPDRVQS
jgi:signal transduction histidine kinase